MVVNARHAFWQALFLAILFFFIGLVVGIMFENLRADRMEKVFLNSEVNLMDSQIMGEVGGIFEADCSVVYGNLALFADRVYDEAKLLERYDSSSQLSEELKILHIKYDLLRIIMWKDIVSLKLRCPDVGDVVVYIYDYDNTPVDIKSKQNAFSVILEEAKEDNGNSMFLIPIAGDAQLASLEVIKNKYNISEFPVVIINDKYVLKDISELKELDSYLDKA